jgi:hypothetical protein
MILSLKKFRNLDARSLFATLIDRQGGVLCMKQKLCRLSKAEKFCRLSKAEKLCRLSKKPKLCRLSKAVRIESTIVQAVGGSNKFANDTSLLFNIFLIGRRLTVSINSLKILTSSFSVSMCSLMKGLRA